jgi:hypothetical protein
LAGWAPSPATEIATTDPVKNDAAIAMATIPLRFSLMVPSSWGSEQPYLRRVLQTKRVEQPKRKARASAKKKKGCKKKRKK